MASGLVALLDDVAAIAKLAAASMDDVAGAASKASAKAAGVVVDDTAVTPSYAMGFTPDRELPIIGKIAIGSLRNKFLILLPGALLVSALAPWALTPILMVGGGYLCLEAVEKLLETFGGGPAIDEVGEMALGSKEREKQMVGSAIRTDLILSAEITAIALADLAGHPLPVQAASLAIVGLVITAGVYGVVAMIVKMDDVGLHLAGRNSAVARRVGAWLVRGMPIVLDAIAGIGTAAMLWVGGGILVHALHGYHLTPIPEWVDAVGSVAGAIPVIGGLTGWVARAAASAVTGLVVGAILAGAAHLVWRHPHRD